MKKSVFYLFWIFICLHATISFSEAAEDVDMISAMNEIDAIIAESEGSGSISEVSSTRVNRQFNSAPIKESVIQVMYTPWELIHRTAMLQGFTWGGEISNFVTRTMYIGTPLQNTIDEVGYDVTLGATNYSECVRIETDNSFGIDGELIEETIEDELRDIAKYCAVEYLGSYFDGKKYTTREEMLMFLFTMFDEEIYLPGYFQNEQFVFDGDETEVPFENISSQAWFAPYLSLAYNLMMIEDEGIWEIAREVTNKDIRTMLEMYLIDEDGKFVDTIETQYNSYTIGLDNTLGITIQKTHGKNMILNSASKKDVTEGVEKSSTDEDIIAELFGE